MFSFLKKQKIVSTLGETTPLKTSYVNEDAKSYGHVAVDISCGCQPGNGHLPGCQVHNQDDNVDEETNTPRGGDVYPGHCHGLRVNKADTQARRRLTIAAILCLVFMVAEILGGYFADSLAIMTDAAHLLTDFASFMISLFALWIATRKPTKGLSFGWYRAEVIGALTSVLLIWVVTAVLVYMAVNRIITGDYEIDATIMLITSGVGVAFNIVMGATLHQHGHGHSHGGHSHGKHGHEGSGGHGHSHEGSGGHGHSHEGSDGHGHSHETNYGSGFSVSNSRSVLHSADDETHADDRVVSVVTQPSNVKAPVNINVRAALIHVIGDLIQSIGVFIAALVIFFKPEYRIVDPICTFVFSVLVLITTIAILKDTLLVLMEGKPKGVDFNEVKESFMSIPGVVKVHNLRLWSLSMDKIAVSAHIVIDPGLDTQEILKQASLVMRERFGFFEMTLQIEDLKEDMNDCQECEGPN